MKKIDFFISALAGIALALLVLKTDLSTTFLAWASEAEAEEQHELDAVAVREQMLQSHKKWDRVYAEAVTHWYIDGQKDSWLSKIHIDPGTNRAHVEVYRLDATVPSQIWTMDGEYVYSANLDTGETKLREIPNFLAIPVSYPLPNGLVDIRIEQEGAPTIVRHPLGMMIPSAAGDYLFPHGYAQRNGAYKVVGQESISGRPATILEFANSDTAVGQRFWVDQETGIILKSIVYNSSDMRKMVEETSFEVLNFNRDFSENTFQIPFDHLEQQGGE